MSRLEWLPVPIRQALLQTRNRMRRRRQIRALRSLASRQAKKIVIGSAGVGFSGWVSTDREVLDLLDKSTWNAYFAPGTLDAILAEHVWEHLEPRDAVAAADTCYEFLEPGGYLRVAVPDGLHPDRSYIDAVKPGGYGDGSSDHKVLYTRDTLSDLFSGVGFSVRLLEYFDEGGEFHYSDWDPAQGMIHRSKRFDSRNASGSLAYTSIILDAVKPGAAQVYGTNM